MSIIVLYFNDGWLNAGTVFFHHCLHLFLDFSCCPGKAHGDRAEHQPDYYALIANAHVQVDTECSSVPQASKTHEHGGCRHGENDVGVADCIDWTFSRGGTREAISLS